MAFDILRKVESGGYASDLLLAHTAGLDSRDAGLASEIVFGVLRYRAQLDFLIGTIRAPRKLDIEVRIALRMGIYQLRYLERVPPHAAVKETVDLVKRARKTSPPGSSMPSSARWIATRWSGPSREVELSCPEWLLARWERNYGAEAAAEIARAALREPVKYSARRARARTSGRSRSCRCSASRPGQSFLDLCAAPGNKTAQALEAGVRAVACDLHFHRLDAVEGPQRRICWCSTERSRCPSPAGSTASWWTRPAPAPERWGAIRRSNGG